MSIMKLLHSIMAVCKNWPKFINTLNTSIQRLYNRRLIVWLQFVSICPNLSWDFYWFRLCFIINVSMPSIATLRIGCPTSFPVTYQWPSSLYTAFLSASVCHSRCTERPDARRRFSSVLCVSCPMTSRCTSWLNLELSYMNRPLRESNSWHFFGSFDPDVISSLSQEIGMPSLILICIFAISEQTHKPAISTSY